jgi:peptidyl-prolyl cis-trans isomerase B (cyclophilin B)
MLIGIGSEAVVETGVRLMDGKQGANGWQRLARICRPDYDDDSLPHTQDIPMLQKALTATLALMLAGGPALAETRVKLETSLGDIVLALDEQSAPDTVANFLQYVRDGFYEGTIFHRVIDGFMIQGGGFTGSYQQKSTRSPIKNEADNGLTNDRGTIAMARTSDPHSATAQFFINVADNTFLNHTAPTAQGWGYAVFGRVVEGMDVVDAIRQVPTGAAGPFRQDAPRTPVLIEKMSILPTE